MTSINTEALAAARRGAALLDERSPGWREKINLDELDTNSCYKCVLGQTYADGAQPGYIRGKRILDLDLDEATRFGFTDCRTTNFSNDDLTEAWRYLLDVPTQDDIPEPDFSMCADPEPTSVDAFIDEWAEELERMYTNRTAGDHSFTGFVVAMMRDMKSKGVQPF